MDNNTQFLQVSSEDFKIGYNYDFTPYIQSDYTGITYLPWSNAYRILRLLFPNLDVGFDAPVEIPNNLDKGQMLAIDVRLESYAEDMKSSDKRASKKATTAFNSLLGEVTNNIQGLYVMPYIYDTRTGARTPAHQFPVMDSTNNFIANPNARELSDSNMRGAVKAIALYTGIGLRLWTRENMDIRKNDNAHPVLKGLQAIYEQKMDCLSEFGTLPDSWEEPDFGWSVFKLRELSSSLVDYLESGAEVEQVWDDWKTPKMAITWAIEVLEITEKEATAILNDVIKSTDAKSFKEPFYYKVMSMVD